MGDSREKVLSMQGIHKKYPGVHALKGVDLDLYAGETLALIGENGAGKSTLIKMLGGAHQPTSGSIELFGNKTVISNPAFALEAGVGVIYQEFNLVPYLSVRENIFLGQEITRGPFINRSEERRRSRELFDRIGIDINPDKTCSELSIAEQQVVEIAKALSQNALILVMDEPSATLTPQEVNGLFQIIRELKKQGIGIIYITHRLDEVFDICDRVYVLRDGEFIGSRPIDQITRREMIEMMVGRNVESEFPKISHPIGKTRLEVKGLQQGVKVDRVSFEVKSGEILGITGLIGAGRTEVVRLIFGADKKDAGVILKDGSPVQIGNPQAAIALGICLLTEDRKGQGLVLIHSVIENFALPNLKEFSNYGVINRAEEKSAFEKLSDSIRIRISGHEQLAGNLSGGNQQKLVLIKWLQKNCDVIIFDEPTRGIDVGAKYEIYLLMNELAAQGKAIIMVSSELPEVLGMSDRILVMRQGQIAGEIKNVRDSTQAQIMEMAVH